MKVILFEDNTHNHFYPLSLTRPLWELRYGCFSIRERWEIFLEKNSSYFKSKDFEFIYYTREYLKDYYQEKHSIQNINTEISQGDSEEVIFINARLITHDIIFKLEKEIVHCKDGIPLFAWINTETKDLINPEQWLLENNDFEKKENISLETIDYIWDLIHINPEKINEDFQYFKSGFTQTVEICGPKDQIYIHPGAVIDSFVVLDTRSGPIMIEENAHIRSFSNIEGPCYIGKNTMILGAKVREGCSIGETCRIGGEVEEAIFHGFSNKYHEGFIGHAYIGEWVNLGALTTNSDLKNDYTTIKTYIPKKKKETGLKKVGSFIGDFSKTSIGTLMITGNSVGVGCMLVHDGSIAPKHIPSFKWWIKNRFFNGTVIDDFLATCAIVCERRKIKFTEKYKQLVKYVYKNIDELIS